jgi:hypothetical protein
MADGHVDDHTRALAQRKCREKKVFGTMMLGLNAGWLLAFKHKTRFAVYRCTQCTSFHLSRQVSRTTALACTL